MLVRMLPAPERTAVGLYIPEGANTPRIAVIEAVGPLCDLAKDNVGNEVIVSVYGGVDIGDGLKIIKEHHIWSLYSDGVAITTRDRLMVMVFHPERGLVLTPEIQERKIWTGVAKRVMQHAGVIWNATGIDFPHDLWVKPDPDQCLRIDADDLDLPVMAEIVKKHAQEYRIYKDDFSGQLIPYEVQAVA